MYLRTEEVIREWPWVSKKGYKHFRKIKAKVVHLQCDGCGKYFTRQLNKDIMPISCKRGPGHYCSECPGFSLAQLKGQKTQAKQHLQLIGNRTLRSAGKGKGKYAWIYVGHNYPYSKPYCGSMFEHVMVMETHLRRAVNDDEIVHHIDGNKLNNDISNLDIMTQQQHNKCHGVAARTLVFELLADGIIKYNCETKRYEKNH